MRDALRRRRLRRLFEGRKEELLDQAAMIAERKPDMTNKLMDDVAPVIRKIDAGLEQLRNESRSGESAS